MLLSAEAIYQLSVLGISATLAFFLYRIIKPRALKKLDGFTMPIAVRRIVKNLVRLIYHFLVLILIFIGAQIGSVENVWYDTSLLEAVMKVLFAWIVIRLAVQFITNNAVRNLFATIIWIIAALSIFGVLEPTTKALDAIGYNIGDFRLSGSPAQASTSPSSPSLVVQSVLVLVLVCKRESPTSSLACSSCLIAPLNLVM